MVDKCENRKNSEKEETIMENVFYKQKRRKLWEEKGQSLV